MKNRIKVGFIGCGNMARAIINSLTGVAAKAAFKVNGDVVSIIASDKDESKLLPLKGVCEYTLDRAAAVAGSDYVVLAVKPQNAEEALSGLDFSEKTVISIMAGVNIERLKKLTAAPRIVRVMPNLNARVGESFNAYVPYNVDGETLRVVQSLLGSFGMFREVKESDMDAVTGISGSGPAFVFLAIKAFYDEAISRGFDAETSKQMAIQTVLGSALTAEKSSASFDELVTSVCSKGGTTIEGVNYLNDNNFVETLRTAIRRAIARSEEMTKAK